MTLRPAIGSAADGIVIAGGGLAAQRAGETLRRCGHDGPIRVVGAERHAPYDRPPLSKELLAGELSPDALRFRPDDWYREHDIELLLGQRAAALDARSRRSAAAASRYDRLSSPRQRAAPCPASAVGNSTSCARSTTRRPARRDRPGPPPRGDRRLRRPGGCRAAHAGRGDDRRSGAAGRLSASAGRMVRRCIARRHRGAARRRPAARRPRSGDRLEGGRRIRCDAVVVAVGTAPATGWLAGSGLDPGGVLVDAAGRTAAPAVFAAGDASRPFEPRLGAHVRTEHWEAAARQGVAAARAMLGLSAAPAPLPSFWSDQHGVRIQYLGHAHGADGVQLDGDPAARDFTATFTAAGRPVAALLVGRPHALPALRRRLEAHRHERTAA
ncbi:MAG: FAD-dependent oxidoreductase [Solirubrobacterales bacterium]